MSNWSRTIAFFASVPVRVSVPRDGIGFIALPRNRNDTDLRLRFAEIFCDGWKQQKTRYAYDGCGFPEGG